MGWSELHVKTLQVSVSVGETWPQCRKKSVLFIGLRMTTNREKQEGLDVARPLEYVSQNKSKIL